MPEAYIYDAVRTPRGKGKRDGSLHEVTPVHLLKNCFDALRERNELDTSLVDDVVLGCVTPIGEQGADIARTAVLYSDWDEKVAGVTQSRFCASGLEAVNSAAAKVPQAPHTPWTLTAPTGSSILRRSKNWIDATTRPPETRPMTMAEVGATLAHGAVMPTRPASAPLSDMPMSGLPTMIQAVTMAATAPAAADRLVLIAMSEKALPAPP